jgi:acyl-CoA synthetase (NDP forming)
MFDLATTLSNQPLPGGRQVAILTNAGGPGILCADACEAGGVLVPELSDETKARLRRFLPPTASVTNPVDMIASAGAEHFRLAIEALLPPKEVDALIVIFIPVGMVNPEAVSQAVCEGVAKARKMGGEGKPVLACLMGEETAKSQLISGRERIPTFAFPECAGQALGKMMAYAEWRKKPLGMIPDFDDMRPQSAREICQQVISERGAGWLSTEETRSALISIGLPVSPGGVARTADGAAALARGIGFPVAVKVASHRIVHKTEIGAVCLNLTNEDAVRQAFQEIRDRLAKEGKLEAMEGVLVQPMISRGVEVMAGVTVDSLFGPLIAFGLGGIHVEILRDVCFRITPLTDADAREMVRGIRGYRLLEGYRGHAAADIAAIEEILLRVSRLVDEVPEISELDLNPIFALAPGEGCRIVDARIRVER